MTEYTLITGASRGLGAAFARRLAAGGQALILTARDGAALEHLGRELQDRHAVPVRTLCLDLAAAEAARSLHQYCARAGWPVTGLINNAGSGRFGAFLAYPAEDYAAMIRLNVVAPVELTRLFLPDMQALGRGRIIHVASSAAFQPTPYLAVYGATKAFLLAFSEALAAECAGTGIRMLTLCPGATRTGFFAAAGLDGEVFLREVPAQSPEAVVDEALRALGQGRRRWVTGWRNRLMVRAGRMLPDALNLKLSARVLKQWFGGPG